MQYKRLLLSSVVVASALAVSAQTQIAEWVQTTRTAQWTAVTPNTVAASSDALTLTVNPKNALQTVVGFGSCFNELGWSSLSELSEQDRQAVLAELFQPGKGANFTMGRMPIGANDFSLNYYSLDETDGDFDMNDFSIAHDQTLLIPFIKSAMRYQPQLKIWGSPWCPPKWMKKNKFYAENADANWNKMILSFKANQDAKAANDPLRFRVGLLGNGTPLNAMGYEGVTSFNMQPQYLKAYAKYFGKYVDAYHQEGINVFMVMPQNESNSAQPYPACCWTAKDLNTFVGKYLGPEMKKRGVEVYVGTCERPDPLKPDTILSDADSKQYVTGAGFQWAGKAAIATNHSKYPALTLYGSEQECGNGLNNWEGAMHSWDLMKEYFTNGVSGYFYWNTSLFEGEPSTWGWYQNSLVTVNRANKTYRFTPEYYVMKHASHYVAPGARLLKTTGTLEEALVFQNPDKSIVVIAANKTGKAETASIKVGKKTFSVTLAPGSLNTLLLK